MNDFWYSVDYCYEFRNASQWRRFEFQLELFQISKDDAASSHSIGQQWKNSLMATGSVGVLLYLASKEAMLKYASNTQYCTHSTR